MQIKVMEPMPVDEYLEPAIEFPIMLTYNRLEVPIGIEGILIAEDNKILSMLQDLPKSGASGDIGNIGALGTLNDNVQTQQTEHNISLVSVLNNKAIDYISNLRGKNIKGDVKFKLLIKVRVMNSNAQISPLHLKDPGEMGPPLRDRLEQMGGDSLVTHKYIRDYVPKATNLWVISGSNGPTFLSLMYLQQELPTIIHSSDWLHDFAPKLGLGKFIVAELPIPTSITITGEFSDRLNKAVEALRKMESKIQEGEWTEAIEKCRPIVELMRDEEMIKSILGKHGYNEDASNSLYSSIKGLFEFSSKFHHKVDKDKKTLLSVTQAEKEDAYFAYSTSIALVNLITQKINKPELA